MSVATVCLSHSPLRDMLDPGDGEVRKQHDSALSEMHDWIVDYDPELIIIFGPDHFHGFFYELMPSFCIGVRAAGIGDWGTTKGDVKVDSDSAVECLRFVVDKGFDVAQSHKMLLDHGAVQPLDWLGIGTDKYPVLPIFINCAGEPQPSMRRVRELGAAVGEYAKGLDKRVLMIGSGGLSHDPPSPRFYKSPAEVQEMMIEKRPASLDDELGLAEFVRAEAIALTEGTRKSECMMPDEAWDRQFLDILVSQKLATADDSYTNESIYETGGRGGHEIRTWLAACAAMQSAEGPYESEILFYRVVPEWLTGMGIMRVTAAA